MKKLITIWTLLIIIAAIINGHFCMFNGFHEKNFLCLINDSWIVMAIYLVMREEKQTEHV